MAADSEREGRRYQDAVNFIRTQVQRDTLAWALLDTMELLRDVLAETIAKKDAADRFGEIMTELGIELASLEDFEGRRAMPRQ